MYNWKWNVDGRENGKIEVTNDEQKKPLQEKKCGKITSIREKNS